MTTPHHIPNPTVVDEEIEKSRIIDICVSPDGKWFTTINSMRQEKYVCVWSFPDGELIDLIDSPNACVIAISSQEPYLACGTINGIIEIKNTRTKETQHTLTGHAENQWVETLAFSPTAPLLLSGSGDASVRMWNANTGTCLFKKKGIHRYKVFDVAFSPCGNRFATCGADTAPRVWDAKTGKLIRELKDPKGRGHTSGASSITYSPCGKWILSGQEGGIVVMWNAKTGKKVKRFWIHTHAIEKIICSEDSEWIATHERASTIAFSELEVGNDPLVIQECRSRILSIDTSPDRRYLLTGHDGRVAIRDYGKPNFGTGQHTTTLEELFIC